MKTHKQTLEPSLIRCVHRLFSADVSTVAGGALGPSQPEVSAQGECTLRGQAVAASDASALLVQGNLESSSSEVKSSTSPSITMCVYVIHGGGGGRPIPLRHQTKDHL